MKTENRLLTIQLLFFLGLAVFIILWKIYSSNQTRLFLKASRIHSEKIVDQVLISHKEKFTGPLNDNSEWDETSNYIRKPTREFEKECVNTLLSTFGINAVWIFNAQGNCLYSVNDSSDKRLLNVLSDIPVNEILTRAAPKCYFFLRKDSVLFEVFGATVVPTYDIRHESTPAGFYFYVKTWDSIPVRNFEQISGKKIRIDFINQEPDTALVPEADFVRRVFRDWKGEPVAVTTFIQEDPLVIEWNTRSRFIITFSLVLGLLFIFFFGYVFRLWVTNPLKSSIRELHKSEERFSQVAESAEEWIWEVDSKGLYTYSNSVVSNILGYQPEELVGKIHYFDLFRPEDLTRLKEEILRVFWEKGTFNRNIKPNLHKNGSLVILESSGSPILDSQGALAGYRGVDMNITERLRAEEELIKSKERAEESDRLKTAFLANTSHEIRTPMNGILGFSQLLSDENLTPQERQSYISIINKNSQLLLRVISDIVDIAKIESNQLTISKTGFNLNKLLEGVYLTFRNEIKTSGKEQIGFTLKLGLPEEESNILSDNARVEQVLYNLLGNALKFTSQGSISFGYQKEEDILIFFVSDSGKGIAPEKQHIIFERFRQEEENYTRKFGGSGLGLSISKGLVELLGGKMWMTSIEGEGSTFFFRLPYIRIEASPSVSADSGRSPDPMDLSGRTILLVDDNIESFELIRTMLKGTKCSMLFAQNGQQSIDFCRNDSSISLVLMDIQMPVMNGYDATREIRKFRPTLPIVALTAYAFREDRIRSLDAGCNDILTKPVQKADLLSMIRKVLS